MFTCVCCEYNTVTFLFDHRHYFFLHVCLQNCRTTPCVSLINQMLEQECVMKGHPDMLSVGMSPRMLKYLHQEDRKSESASTGTTICASSSAPLSCQSSPTLSETSKHERTTVKPEHHVMTSICRLCGENSHEFILGPLEAALPVQPTLFSSPSSANDIRLCGKRPGPLFAQTKTMHPLENDVTGSMQLSVHRCCSLEAALKDYVAMLAPENDDRGDCVAEESQGTCQELAHQDFLVPLPENRVMCPRTPPPSLPDRPRVSKVSVPPLPRRPSSLSHPRDRGSYGLKFLSPLLSPRTFSMTFSDWINDPY